ncbi:MAG TPA: cytochrome c oxidase subunit 4 [Kineosporiaceae bacterium]
MKVESWLFGAGAFFFAPIGIVYGFVTRWREPLGVTGILLTAALSLMIATYFWITSRRIGIRPEDDPEAEISEGAGEVGHFSPYSWTPLWLGLACALIFAGLAVGAWLFLIGLVAAALAVVLWVFEYYRGEHAH